MTLARRSPSASQARLSRIRDGRDPSCAEALAADAGGWRTRASDAGLSDPEAGRARSRTMLDQIMFCEELFHTLSGVAFADFITDGHRETWPIRSKRFRGWLRRRYYEATGAAASAGEIGSALDLLEARAQFDGPERTVHIRIAEHAGHIYLDLADDDWRAVDIGPDGWRIVECPPVRFRRSPGTLALPMPEQGGSIEALDSFLNLPSRNEFVLSSPGCWAPCDHEGRIHCRQFPANKAPQRPSSPSC